MSGKSLDAKTIEMLLEGKRNLEPKPKKPRPENTETKLQYNFDDSWRPEWHKWVYGGQRKPNL